MIPELGHFALILALCVALVQGSLPIYGAAVGNSALMAVAKPAARGQFLLVLIAFGCLAYAFAKKVKAPANPWGVGATTLEWTLPSPPPFHTYETLPRIK